MILMFSDDRLSSSSTATATRSGSTRGRLWTTELHVNVSHALNASVRVSNLFMANHHI